MERREKIRRILCCISCVFMILTASYSVAASQIPPEEAAYTPMVPAVVNSAAKQVRVYGYAGTTLEMYSGKALLAKKSYKKDGFKNISFSPQKPGRKIKFYLLTSYGKKGKTVVRTVLDIAGEKQGKSLKAPKVRKNISNGMSRIRVYTHKNTVLLIKDDKAGTLFQKRSKKTGWQNVPVKIPADTSTLYFYEKRGNRRSSIISRSVADKIPPAAPRIIKKDTQGIILSVKGEVGCGVYIKTGGKWFRTGTILNKGGLRLNASAYTNGSEKSYKIKLRDSAGNSSKSVTVKCTENIAVI